jgi:hypothetical protein
MADEHVLHLAAAIDEDRVRMIPEVLVGLPGLEVLHAAIIGRRRKIAG